MFFLACNILMADPDLTRVVAVARAAMATRFEIVLPGDNAVRLRSAGEAALDEIELLEAQLSFYRPESELSRLNRRAATEPVQLEPQFFQLLERAQKIHQLTGGAFDPTIGPLMRCWGFVGAEGRMPDPEQLEQARAVTGMHLVQLDRAARSVRFERAGVMLDLGAIGKGYAIERAVEILRDLGIENAIIHGGTSTVYAFGQSPEAEDWKVAIPRPSSAGASALESRSTDLPGLPLAVVSLRDRAISVSAVWGKAFESEGKVYGHVFDPRLGRPVAGALMAAVVTASATDADACSTALMVLGAQGFDLLSRNNSTTGLLVVEPGTTPGPWKVSTRGIALEPGENGRSSSHGAGA